MVMEQLPGTWESKYSEMDRTRKAWTKDKNNKSG